MENLATLYLGRSLVRITVINVIPRVPIDLQYIVICGWQVQAVMSMVFIFYWQRHGVIKYLLEDVISNSSIIAKSFVMYGKLRCTFYQWIILVVTMTSSFGATTVTDTAQKIINSVHIWQPTMGIHPFDFVYRLVPIYGVFVRNIVLCVFVIVMKCLSLELKEFKLSLDRLLQEDNQVKMADRYPRLSDCHPDRLSRNLSLAFDIHNRLARKIRKCDIIFQYYILLMMVVGIPTTIFAIIVLVRRDTMIGALFSIPDAMYCAAQLIAFTLVPAQIHNEYQSIRTQLCRNTSLHQHYDGKLYHITLIFIDQITQTNAGISLGGLVVIRKVLLFTCVTLVTPYVILSLQLNIGGPNSFLKVTNTFFRVSNTTAYT
ncbi:GUstatory Receptor family [Ditylenchus destructor]|uniref:GUstatory Receptor family n=1 Tax=Ditylenchus destructor TaxID=166010 RepID=A0AAD4R1E6_9BILA|nr:GUstatory Receptor family [Ditylenchus destructor]